MKTWPDVRRSRPATQCMSVRLARTRRAHDGGVDAGGEADRHVVERVDGGVTVAVDLRCVDGLGGVADRRGRRRGAVIADMPLVIAGVSPFFRLLSPRAARAGGSRHRLGRINVVRDDDGRYAPSMECPSCHLPVPEAPASVRRAGTRCVSRRRAPCRHGGVRRSRRLHVAVGIARPRAGEEPGRRLLRAAGRRHRRVRRPGRQDHRRRHRRPVRRARRPRGRRRAGRAGRACGCSARSPK